MAHLDAGELSMADAHAIAAAPQRRLRFVDGAHAAIVEANGDLVLRTAASLFRHLAHVDDGTAVPAGANGRSAVVDEKRALLLRVVRYRPGATASVVGAGRRHGSPLVGDRCGR